MPTTTRFFRPPGTRRAQAPPQAALALLLAGAALAAACAEGPPGARDAAAREARAAPGPPPALPDPEVRWWRASGVLAVDDAVRVGDRWVLLDGMEARVHLVDGPGAIRSVGARGDGPGELRAPRQVAASGPAGFQVVSAGGVLDRFDSTGAFVDRRTVAAPRCGLAEVREAVALDGRLYLAAICLGERTRRFALLEAGPGEVARHLVDRPAPGEGAWTLDAPALAVVDGLLAWGDGSGRCADLLEPGTGVARGRRCLEGLPVPLPDRVRADLEGPLGRRARAAGIRVAVPDALPWYDALLPGPAGVLLARRPVGDLGWTLAPMDGRPGGWAVPPWVAVHASGGRILLVHTGAEGVALADLPASALPFPALPGASGGGGPEGSP